MRAGLYPATVWAFDATTGIASVSIRQLFGDQVVPVEPEVARQADIADIIPVANGDIVLVFFEGADDSRLKWMPRVIDDQMTAFYDARYVNVTGDTMSGGLQINSTLGVSGVATMTGTLTAVGAGSPQITAQRNDAVSPAIAVVPGTAAGDRASISLGDWEVGQDVAANGSRDFFFYNGANRLAIAPGGTVTVLNNLIVGQNVVVNATGNSVQLPNSGVVYALDSGGTPRACLYPRWSDNRTYLDGGSGVSLRTSNGATTNLALETDGTCRALNAYTWQTDTDSGLFFVSDGRFDIRSNGGVTSVVTNNIMSIQGAQNCVLRLYDFADGNHELQYRSDTPSGSGVGSNGPRLQGYSSVWLRTAQADKNLFLTEPSGSVFINAGSSYTNFSSREFKNDVVTLDGEAALSAVRRWRPVTFTWLTELNTPNPRGTGFIAEELVKVTPELVSVEGPESDRPGWPNAVAYAETTPYLAAAVQGLLARIERLEAKLAASEVG